MLDIPDSVQAQLGPPCFIRMEVCVAESLSKVSVSRDILLCGCWGMRNRETR